MPLAIHFNISNARRYKNNISRMKRHTPVSSLKFPSIPFPRRGCHQRHVFQLRFIQHRKEAILFLITHRCIPSPLASRGWFFVTTYARKHKKLPTRTSIFLASERWDRGSGLGQLVKMAEARSGTSGNFDGQGRAPRASPACTGLWHYLSRSASVHRKSGNKLVIIQPLIVCRALSRECISWLKGK